MSAMVENPVTALPTVPVRLGQNATTLRTQTAEFIPVITDVAYKDRMKRPPWVSYNGARPIHRTTLMMDRKRPKLDYITLYEYVSKVIIDALQ